MSSTSSGGDALKPGDRVTCSGGAGTVQFYGTTKFAAGVWAGVVLDEPRGKNDGSVMGIRYFDCEPNYGLFLRASQVKPLEAAGSSPAVSRSADSVATPPATRSSRSSVIGRSMSVSGSSSSTSPAGPGTPRAAAAGSAGKRMSMIAAAQAAALGSNRPPARPTTPSAAGSSASADPISRTTTPIHRSMSPESVAPTSPAAAAPAPVVAETPKQDDAAMAALRDLVTNIAANKQKQALEMQQQQQQQAESAAASAAVSRVASPKVEPPAPVPVATPTPTPAPAPAPVQAAPAPAPVAAPVPATPTPVVAQPIPAPAPVPEPVKVEPVPEPESAPAPAPVVKPAVAAAVIPRAASPPAPVPAPLHVEDDISPVTSPPPSTSRSLAAHPTHISMPTPSREQLGFSQQSLPFPATPAATVPLKDYEELRAKVKLLETKRSEDLATIRRLEDLQQDAQHAIAARDKLHDRVTELQTEVRELRREAKSAAAERDELEEKLAETTGALELVTLDKELAEEKCETLEQELDASKDRCEELALDLEVVRGELELGEHEAAQTAADPTAVLQLQRQNERLKDAIVKLKESRDDLEEELGHRIRVLETEAAQGADAKAQYALAREQLAVAEETIDELRAALEDASGAEELVEELSEKNLHLNEKLDDLQRYIDDLEAMKELNEELEDNHVETERELLLELDARDRTIRDLENQLARNEDALADYERTIGQFRELVKNLTRENEELRATTATPAAAAAATRALGGSATAAGAEQQEMLAMSFKLQTHAMKVQAKTIDLELKHLEAAQAAEHVALLQVYLPDAFFVTEQEPIAALLIARRIQFKADVLQRYAKSTSSSNAVAPTSPTTASSPEAASDAATMDLAHELSWMRGAAHALAAFIESCPADTFVAVVGRTHGELASAERRLDTALTQLKSDGALRAAATTPDLARINRQLDATLAKLTAPPVPVRAAVHRRIQLVAVQGTEDAAARAAVAVQALAGLSVMDGVAETLAMQLANVRASARKLSRVLTDAKAGLGVNAASVNGVLANVQLSAAYLKDLAQRTGVLHGDDADEDDEGVVSPSKAWTADALHEEVASATVRHFDKTEPRPLAVLVDTVKRAAADLAVLYETTSAAATAGEPADPLGPSAPAPWSARADALKRERATDAGMQAAVADAQARLTRALTELRAKDEEVRELVVKCQLLESRSLARESAAANAAQAEDLARTVDAQANEIEDLNRFVDHLKGEAHELEAANRELARKLKAAEASRASSAASAAPASAGPVATLLPRHPAGPTASSVQALVAGIAHLRAENARLRAGKLLAQLELCPVPRVAPAVAEESVTESDEPQSSSSMLGQLDGKLRDVALETRALLRQARELASSPRVVDLSTATDSSKSRRTPAWASLEKRASVQLQRQRVQARLLARKAAMLQGQVFRLQHPVGTASPVAARIRHSRRMSGSSSFSFATQLTGIDKTPRVARVRVPVVASVVPGAMGSGPQGGARVNCYVSTPAELEKLHAVFVN
ncbi:hypothetical protein H9P43_008359 [Blastocladiella emersonii ATCC 22665]|nr:hypothetical protein H9P43_008359 [Blastocladiella emersonii ATCC 22665]